MSLTKFQHRLMNGHIAHSLFEELHFTVPSFSTQLQIPFMQQTNIDETMRFLIILTLILS